MKKYSNIPSYIDPSIALILQGFRLNRKPGNWFTKLFWRWIYVEIRVTMESENLSDLIPKHKWRDKN